MATQCLHSDDFDPNDFTIISGPYSSESGCYENCICPDTDCGPSGIDPVTCNCTPLPSGNDPDPPGDPDLDCDGLDGGGSVTISGYAYYRDAQSTVTVLGQTLTSPCWGGHWCDRAEFTPTLVLSDNSVLTGSNNINLDNGSGGGDRSDTFSFTLTGNPALYTSGTQFVLNCAEQNNNCHFGITWIVLTMEDAVSGSGEILFNSCVTPGSLEGLNLKCPSGVACDTTDYTLTHSTSGALQTCDGYSGYDTTSYSATLTFSGGLDSSKFDWISPYDANYFTGYDLYTAEVEESADFVDVCGGFGCMKIRDRNWLVLCSGNILWDLTGIAASGKDFTYTDVEGNSHTSNYADWSEYCVSTSGSVTANCDDPCIPPYYYNLDPSNDFRIF